MGAKVVTLLLGPDQVAQQVVSYPGCILTDHAGSVQLFQEYRVREMEGLKIIDFIHGKCEATEYLRGFVDLWLKSGGNPCNWCECDKKRLRLLYGTGSKWRRGALNYGKEGCVASVQLLFNRS